MPKKRANWWEDPGQGIEPTQGSQPAGGSGRTRTWWGDPRHVSEPGDGSETGGGSERKEGNAQGTGKRKFSKKFYVAVSGGLATVASVVTIVAFIQSQHHSGTPTFDDTDLRTSASQFASFLSGVDGKVVYLDVGCGMLGPNNSWPYGGNSKCVALDNNYGNTGGDQDYRYVLSLGSFSAPTFITNGSVAGNPRDDAQTVFVDVDVIPNTGAQVFNGVKGAGWIEVKGYFSVSGYQMGTAPPGSADYTLSSVSQSISAQ
jgi:hypothetical protein